MSFLLLQNGTDKLLLQNGTDFLLLQDSGGGAGAARRAINQRFLATGSYAAQQVQV